GRLKDRGGGCFGAAAVDVDQRGDFDIGDREDFADMRGSPRANAHDRDAYTIVCAGPGLRSGRGSREEEITAVHNFRMVAVPVYSGVRSGVQARSRNPEESKVKPRE